MKPTELVVGLNRPWERTTEAEKLKKLNNLRNHKLLKPFKSLVII